MQLQKFKSKLHQVILACVSLFLLSDTDLSATNFIVNSTSDSPTTNGTLRFALLNASASTADIITFAPTMTGQTITLTDYLPLVNGIPIFGPTGNTTINGIGSFSGFFINSGTSTISNLNFTNMASIGGNGGSGMAGGGGALGAGAGIFVNTGSTVTLQNVFFLNNTSTGGAGGTVVVVSGNSAGGGGGGFTSNGGSSTAMNSGNGGGGGLFNSPGGSTINSGTDIGNAGGGGVNGAPGGAGASSGGGGGGYLDVFSAAGGAGVVDNSGSMSASGGGGGGIGTAAGALGNPGNSAGVDAVGGNGGGPGGGAGGTGTGAGTAGSPTGGGGGGGGGPFPSTGSGGAGGAGGTAGGGGGGGGTSAGNGGNATVGGGGGAGGGFVGGVGGNGGSVSSLGGGGGGVIGGNGSVFSGGGGGQTGGSGGLGGGGGGSFVNVVPSAGGFGAGPGGIVGTPGGNASGFGGAIFVSSGGTLNIKDGQFLNNNVNPGGVGAFAAGNDLYLMNSSNLTYTVSQPNAIQSLFIGGFDNQSTFLTGQGGSLTKNGPGTLVLNSTPTVTYNGQLVVQTGTLVVNNVIGSSALVNHGSQLLVNGQMNNALVTNATLIANGALNNVILNGGFVKGTGFMNSLTMNGGQLSPGNNGFGTISIGTLSQNNASNTNIKINPLGQSDVVNVLNTANIAGTLNFIPAQGFYFAGTTYTFLQAAGGLTGTFNPVILPFPVIGQLLYNPFAVQLLILENTIAPGLPPLTGNPGVVEDFLKHVFVFPNSDFANVLMSLNSTDNDILRSQLIQLQPSWFVGLDWATENTMANAAQIISNNVFQRVLDYKCCCSTISDPYYRDAESDAIIGFNFDFPKNFWIAASGGHLNQSSIQQLPSFRTNDWGLLAGVDCALSNWLTLGLATGYNHSDLQWDSLNGTNAIHDFFIGPYAALNCGNWILDASILKGWHRYRSDRHIIFSTIDRKAKNTHYGDSILCHLGVTYDYNFWDWCNIVPYLSADYIYIHAKGFQEKGANSIDLHISEHNIPFFQGEIGAAFSKTFQFCEINITPTFWTGIQNITPITGTKLTSGFVGSQGTFIVETTKDPIYQWTTGFYTNFRINDWSPVFSLSFDSAVGDKRWEVNVAGEIDWCY